MRRTNMGLKADDYIFIDPSGGQQKTSKLGSPAVGPFRTIAGDGHKFIFDRAGQKERVSCDRVTSAPLQENLKSHRRSGLYVRTHLATPCCSRGRPGGIPDQMGGLRQSNVNEADACPRRARLSLLPVPAKGYGLY